MTITSVAQWSTDQAQNTDVDGNSIAEACSPAGINNAIRGVMAQIADTPLSDDPDTMLTDLGGSTSGKQAFKYDFNTVTLLLADTVRTYSNTTAGDFIRTRSEGFAYEVAASGASNQDITTAGGLKLYARPSTGLIAASQYGATGVSNDTTAIGTALTEGGVVVADIPIIVNTGISAGTGTLILPKPAILTGTVSMAEAQAILFNRGFIGGVPMVNSLRDKRFGIIAGAMRQNASTPTQWDYINDATHEPMGVSGTYATASSSTITVSYDRTYAQVGSFICGPDETLANAINFSCGASVGLSSAVIKASMDRTLAITAQYNGSAWLTSYGTGQGGGGILPDLVSVSHLGANVTITHSHIPGVDATVFPWTVGGAYVPKPVAIKSIGNTTTVVNFIDPTTWTFDTTADTSWAFIYQKRFAGGIVLDTTDYALDTGNLWFYGIMLVD